MVDPKVFLDTNIFVRFLIPENPTIHQECAAVIDTVRQGKTKPYISTIIIHELLFILFKIYKLTKTQVLGYTTDILNLRNLTIIEKTDVKAALKLFSKYNIKFGDCLIATQIPPGVPICTYDPDFAKLPFLTTLTPEKVLVR